MEITELIGTPRQEINILDELDIYLTAESDEEEIEEGEEETEKEKADRVKRAVETLNGILGDSEADFNENYRFRGYYETLRRKHPAIEEKIPDDIDMKKFSGLQVFVPHKDTAFTYTEATVKFIQKLATLDMKSHLDPDTSVHRIKLFTSLRDSADEMPAITHKDTKYGDTIVLNRERLDDYWYKKDFDSTDFSPDDLKKLIKKGDTFLRQTDGFSKQKIHSIYSGCKFTEKQLMKLSRDECRKVITRVILLSNSVYIVGELMSYVCRMFMSIVENAAASPKKLY